MLSAWMKAFALTLLLELPFVTILLRQVEGSLGRRLALGFFANLSTHPLVWFVLMAVSTRREVAWGVSEGTAVLLEGLFYALTLERLGLRRAMAVSLIANLVSALIGSLFYRWAGAFLLS